MFWLVINALMLELASALLAPGFQVRGFLAAFIGAIVLSLVNMVLKGIVMPPKDRRDDLDPHSVAKPKGLHCSR